MFAEALLMTLSAVAFGVATVRGMIAFFRVGPGGRRGGGTVALAGALLAACALIVHGVSSGRLPVFGRFESISFYALAVAIVYLSMSWRHEMRGLSLIVLPYLTVLAGVAAGAAIWPSPVDLGIHSIWLDLHILAALSGYALFTLAGVLAFGYLVQDRNLKHKRFGPTYQRLAPLETLDHLMSGQIQLAFVLFSISILLGVVLAQINGWQLRWVTDPKIVATAVTWVVYAVLFYLRMSADYHGRKVAFVTIVGLVCVVFTFFGVHWLARSMHEFAPPAAQAGAT